jgi:hypothetical protein
MRWATRRDRLGLPMGKRVGECTDFVHAANKMTQELLRSATWILRIVGNWGYSRRKEEQGVGRIIDGLRGKGEGINNLDFL